jgi:type IV pilus assembly protein PilV
MNSIRRHAVRGFSLVESMVALVVLSVGMIGMAALYNQGLGAGRTAQFRTQAVNLASDMADRIRVNRLGQASYANAPVNNSCDPQSGGGVDCTPALMAVHDRFVWEQQVQQMLPNGQGAIAVDAATMPMTFTITVTWDEVGLGQLTHQVVVQVPTI